MATNLNTNPYYDDFDEFKNFHQVLFRPGYAVQARELTQIQSILRNQIAKFGNHIFKHGSVVIPGNSFAELNTPYVKLEPQYSGLDISAAAFADQLLVGSVSGVKAIATLAFGVIDADPNTLYLSYVAGGTTAGVPNGNLTFLAGEEIYVESNITVRATVQSGPTAVGMGSVAHVNAGVYYVNGTFVSVEKQSTVLSKYTSTPSVHVLFKINEELITSDTDSTLLDPAQGSYNFAAPGADRLKISLTLTTLALDATISNDYFEIMRYNNGVLEEHARYPKYNELEKSLAQRTYDESGDYIVSGLGVAISEHKKTLNNGGVYPDGDTNLIAYNVSPGKAYINGFGVEKLASTVLSVNKARTAAHVIQEATTMKANYGQTLLITGIIGAINTDARETLQLWNSSNLADASDAQIGTAKALAIDYYDGDGSTSPIFRIYVSDISLNNGYTYESIGSIRTAGGASAKVVNEYFAPLTAGAFDFDASPDVINTAGSVRSATVAFWNPLAGKLYAHKHTAVKDTPKIGEQITGSNSAASTVVRDKIAIKTEGQSSLVFKLPRNAIKALKNASNASDFTFTYHKKLIILSGASSTAAISTGTIVPIEAGTLVAVNASGLIDESNFQLNGSGTAIEYRPGGVLTNVAVDTHLYCQITVVGAQPRTKSLLSNTQTGLTAGAVITLNKADVANITSIIKDGVDIKSYYTLSINATEYAYEYSTLVLKKGITAPTGTVDVSYTYYQHTAGDFFSVDSYPTYDTIPMHRSTTTGEMLELRDCIDFRQTVGSTNSLIVDDSVVSTSLQRYLGRYDQVVLDAQGKLSVLSGIPADAPKQPSIPAGMFSLATIYVPAYTPNITDVRMVVTGISRSTMRDISNLKDRVSRLEDFSTLTAAEAVFVRTNVIDAASGLDRFKTGYMVENFIDPFGIAEVNTVAFRSTMNSTDGVFAFNEPTPIPLSIYNAPTNTYKNTNGVLTLPYTETAFAEVGVSSRTTNLNPFLLTKWDGVVQMNPSADVWVEVVDLPELFNTVQETKTVFIDVIVPVQSPAPAQAPAAAPSAGLGQFVIGPGIIPQSPSNSSVVVGPLPAPAPSPASGVSTATPAPSAPIASPAAPAPTPISTVFNWDSFNWDAEGGRGI